MAGIAVDKETTEEETTAFPLTAFVLLPRPPSPLQLRRNAVNLKNRPTGPPEPRANAPVARPGRPSASGAGTKAEPAHAQGSAPAGEAPSVHVKAGAEAAGRSGGSAAAPPPPPPSEKPR